MNSALLLAYSHLSSAVSVLVGVEPNAYVCTIAIAEAFRSAGEFALEKELDYILAVNLAGNTVYSGEALCSASVLIFSSSALENGETYTLYVNNTETGTATASADGSGSTGGNSGNKPSGNQSGSNTTSNDQTDSFETDAPDNSSADSSASSSSDSNTGLWIAIGVLSAALTVIIILLCKTYKK